MTFHMTGQGYAKLLNPRGSESTEGLVQQEQSQRTLLRASFDRGDYNADPVGNSQNRNGAHLRH